MGGIIRADNNGFLAAIRIRSGMFRRVMLIATTAQGRELREQILPPVQQTYFELRESIDDATWRALMDGLEDLVKGER